MAKRLIIPSYNHIHQEFAIFVQDLDNICKILKNIFIRHSAKVPLLPFKMPRSWNSPNNLFLKREQIVATLSRSWTFYKIVLAMLFWLGSTWNLFLLHRSMCFVIPIYNLIHQECANLFQDLANIVKILNILHKCAGHIILPW